MKSENVNLYLIHSKSEELEKKEKESLEVIQTFLEKVKRPYVAFSGGKDSTVLLHLVSRITKNIDVYSEYNDLDYPEKKDFCIYYVKEFLQWPDRYYMGTVVRNDEFDQEGWFDVTKQFIKDGGYDGCLLGFRQEESKNRRILYYQKGFIYQLKNSYYAKMFGFDGMYNCIPLAKWSGVDVFGYIAKYDLPYLPVYDYDDFKKPHEIRVSWYFTGLDKTIDNSEAMLLKKYYPELYQKLVSKYKNLINL